jgi:maleylpyruvate isomerase
MKLYGYWRSSSAYRVRIALELKGLRYETASVHLVRDGGEQHRPGFVARNPMQQVPVLEVDEGGATVRLSQSMAIIDYLDARFPQPPLLPGDPLDRARARELAEIVNSGPSRGFRRASMAKRSHANSTSAASARSKRWQ